MQSSLASLVTVALQQSQGSPMRTKSSKSHSQFSPFSVFADIKKKKETPSLKTLRVYASWFSVGEP